MQETNERSEAVRRAGAILRACRGGNVSDALELAYIRTFGITPEEMGAEPGEIEGYVRAHVVDDARTALAACRAGERDDMHAKYLETHFEIHGFAWDDIGSSEEEVRSHLLAEAEFLLGRVRAGERMDERSATLGYYLECNALCSHVTPERLGMTALDVALMRAAALHRSMRYAVRCRCSRPAVGARIGLRSEVKKYRLTATEIGLTDDEVSDFLESPLSSPTSPASE